MDPNWGPADLNKAKIRFFAIFLSLDCQFFFKLHRIIASNNVSLLVEVRFTAKFWGSKFEAKGPKWDPKLGFPAIFLSLVHHSFWNLRRMVTWNKNILVKKIEEEYICRDKDLVINDKFQI